jgi:tetratricopeptide (TPR) repeat protein
LQVDAGNREAAIAAYRRLLFITPVGDEDLHRKLGQLLEEKQNWQAAAVEYNAIAVSKPVDPAAAYYNLARVLYAGGRIDEARDQVIAALEAAPGYRAAQKLLLQLEAAAGKKDE